MKRGVSVLLCLLLAVGMLCSATGCGEKYEKKEESSALSEEAQEARDAAEVYYKSHFVKDTDIGLCADVTGDEIPELIAVRYTTESPGAIEGTVYTLSNGKMKLIYTKRGSFYHDGGFFSWYLAPNGENSFYLAEETHAMWTGIGTVTTRVYQLDVSGNEKEIDCLEFTTSDSENLEKRDNGEWHIKQSAWDAYGDDVQEMMEGGYIIYTNASNCDLFHALSYLDDEYYLSDLRELSDTPPSLEDIRAASGEESSDTSVVTPVSASKPTSPVDRPHVDTVDAAFWRDAEPAIEAWKRVGFFGGACEFEALSYDTLCDVELDDESEQNRLQDCLRVNYTQYISPCCDSYEDVEEENQEYFSKEYIDQYMSGDNAVGAANSDLFEINGSLYSVPGQTKGGVSPSINTTAPSFDFSDPSRPVVRVYNPILGGIDMFSFTFIKEDGKYKIDDYSATGSWDEMKGCFSQLENDLSQYYDVSIDDDSTLFDSYNLDGSFSNCQMWKYVSVENADVDALFVNMTTGEVREAVFTGDGFSYSWDDYSIVGSFYVPISW